MGKKKEEKLKLLPVRTLDLGQLEEVQEVDVQLGK
jgi:hypothetical protein